MARFISINTFSQLFEDFSSLLTEEGLQQFRTRLRGSEGESICKENRISDGDLSAFLKSIESVENVLFYSWTARNKELENLLEGRKFASYSDSAGMEKHQLFEKYQRFISPFLSQGILSSTPRNLVERVIAFSYVHLLDDDHNALVEQQLFNPIQAALKDAYEIVRHNDEEQILIDLLQPLCADEVIQCVNSLSRSMYSAKLGYVDSVLKFIRTKACTVRFANWILKRMELVELNAEHEHKITDLRAELKEGKLKVRNDGTSGRTPVRWRSILTFAMLLTLSGVVIYIIVYKPFSEVIIPEENNNTSFKQFTLEERKKIDSLLKEMGGSGHQDDFIDYGAPIIGGSAVLTLRKEFTCAAMETIFEDLDKDARLQEMGYADSCTQSNSYKHLPGVEDLNGRSGANEAMFRNDSEFDIIIYIGDGFPGGEVYSARIKKGKQKVFKLNLEDEIIVVPGLKYQEYNPPNVTAAELPSADFTYHFCETDFNYRELINTPYRLENSGKGKIKFLISGDKGDYVRFVDIYGVLEPM